MFIILAPVLLSIASLFDVLILYLSTKGDPNTTRTYLTLMTLGTFLWGVHVLLFLITKSTLFIPTLYVSAIFFLLMRYVFVYSYTNTPHSWKHDPVTYLGFFFIFAAFFPNTLVSNPHIVVDGGYVLVDRGTLTLPFSIFLMYLTIQPIYLLIKRHLIKQKVETLYFTIGLAFYAIVSILSNLILPVFFDIYYFNTIGPAFSMIFNAFVLYLIFRYQFLQIKPILQEGLIYSIIVLGITSVYAALFVIVTPYFSAHPYVYPSLLFAVTLGFGIFFGPKTLSFLRTHTEILFYASHYDLSEAMGKLSNIFANNTSHQTLLSSTLRHLKTTLSVHDISFLSLGSTEPSWTVYSFGVKTTQNKPCGTLYISKKISLDPLHETDKKLIAFYISILGIALEKATIFEKIEAEVDQRTKALTQAHSREQALYERIAHDLKTPFTVLKGIHELMQQRGNKEIAPDLHNALTKSIDDFTLAFQRLTESHTEEQSYEYTHTSLSDLVERLIEFVQPVCEVAHITLDTEIIPDIFVSVPHKLLEEIVTNLLSNAIKYTRGCQKQIITLALTKTEDEVSLRISDTGIGIPENDKKHIFEKGFRACNVGTCDGTGHGLQRVRSLAHVYHITIDIQSTEHIGTTVILTFPSFSIKN